MSRGILSDDPVEIHPGDVFFGLDWLADLVPRYQDWFQEIRLVGAKAYFLAYDLLPAIRPEFFPDNLQNIERNWLGTISRADGVVCISQTVADDLQRWLQLFGKRDSKDLKIGWWHMGSDLTRKVSGNRTLPAQARLFDAMAKRRSFLMVGTIEPRKGHAQVLAAFELLWREGVNANLVIVGKFGWLADIEEQLRLHPERNRKLFWLQGVGDDLLEQIYAASNCLIAASADEGFGLPLIEAARHRLPVLARDIAVFREVAGEHASYFSGDAPRELAGAIKSWLDLDRDGGVPSSEGMPWLTWQQSTQNLLDIILDGNWQSQWVAEKDADLVVRYWGSDDRLYTLVGERRGERLFSMGRAGELLYGPYIPLKKGDYRAIIHGKVGFGGTGGARADVVIKGATFFLAEAYLQPGQNAQDAPLATLDFSLDENCTDLEIRFFAEEETDVQVSLVEIRNSSAQPDRPASGNGKHRTARPQRALPPAPSKGVEHRYWATHPRLNTQVGHPVGRAIWSTGKLGHLLHGPYISLPAGRYAAAVYGALNRPGGFGDAHIDAAAKLGVLQLDRKKLSEGDPRPGVLGAIEFSLDGYVDDLEVRVWVDAEADLHVTGIEITEVLAEAEAPVGAATLATPQAEPEERTASAVLMNGSETAMSPEPQAGTPLSTTIGTAEDEPPGTGIGRQEQRASTRKQRTIKSRESVPV